MNSINYLDQIWEISNKSKYAKWYIGIIKKVQSRNFKTKKEANDKFGYIENHHILPKSFGGNKSKENLIMLSAREHFIAHMLLSKMFDNKNHKIKMEAALWAFINGGNSLHRPQIKINSRLFETIRKNKSQSMVGNKINVGRSPTQETRLLLSNATTGENNPMFGKHHSEETKMLISKSLSGENNPMFGVTGEAHPLFGFKHSDETKQLLSVLNSGENNSFYGCHHSEETKQLLSILRTGTVVSEETRQKISIANKGKIVSEEQKQLMSKLQTGENNSFYGKTHSEKTKEKMKIKRAKDKLNVDIFEKWIIDNELPTDIIWTGKIHGFPEKLYYVKELNKRGILKIEV